MKRSGTFKSNRAKPDFAPESLRVTVKSNESFQTGFLITSHVVVIIYGFDNKCKAPVQCQTIYAVTAIQCTQQVRLWLKRVEPSVLTVPARSSLTWVSDSNTQGPAFPQTVLITIVF